jgi:type II secretory pathway predicted ATPase ExeA
MYQAYFALREEPFGVSPDGRYFLETEQHREALATLYYGIRQRRGFALLVGGAGLGKTSVLVQLIKRLEHEAETAYLPHPYFDSSTVLESILTSLGLDASPSLARNHRLFYEYLIKTQRTGKTCVVVFDEAQNLNRGTLEAIRMLSNFETSSAKLVQIVLAGQPPLAGALRRPDYEQIRQRLNVIARLQPLDKAQVREYMEHRLKVAGGSTSLFTPSALDSIFDGSGGVPRNVNTICFNSLTLAYALNQRQVSREAVTEVLRDLDLSVNDARLESKRSLLASSSYWVRNLLSAR